MIDALGKITVTTPGTPVRATINRTDPAKVIPAHGVMFEVWPTNTGLCYVGRVGMNKATGEGVYAILGAPSKNTNDVVSFLPTFSAALTLSPNGMQAADFYVDADQAGDGVIATYLQT